MHGVSDSRLGQEMAGATANSGLSSCEKAVVDNHSNVILKYNENQNAVIQLAKEAKKNGGLSVADAERLLDWAKEYNVPAHNYEIEQHLNRPEITSRQPHIHIGKTGHIPVTDMK